MEEANYVEFLKFHCSHNETQNSVCEIVEDIRTAVRTLLSLGMARVTTKRKLPVSTFEQQSSFQTRAKVPSQDVATALSTINPWAIELK